ncbi:MAG: hypothetical protein IJJ23_09440 [Clostridia bacterium]|nr:hypothetical protein [Clostridia bacterium]
MEGQEKVKLFREKSLEAIESPESLNDYLRVTSPSVWLVMGVVIALLAGALCWGVFGSIDTKAQLAVSAVDGQALCYVPYDQIEGVLASGEIEVEGVSYALAVDGGVETAVITEETNPLLRLAGRLNPGEMTAALRLEDAALPDGVYTGTVVTERLNPLSLLFN